MRYSGEAEGFALADERQLLAGSVPEALSRPPATAPQTVHYELSDLKAGGSRPAALAMFRKALGTIGEQPWREPQVLAENLREAVVREYEMGTGFLFVPVVAGIGVLIYNSLAMEPALGALLMVAAAFLAGVLVAGRRSLAAAVALSVPLIASAAMVSAKLQTMRMSTPMVGSEIASEVSGYVAQVEHRADGRTRLTIDITSTARPQLKYQPERVRLTMRRGPDLRAGDHITGRARLTPHFGPVLPGSYDFAYHAFFDGIGGNGFYLGKPAKTSPPVPRGMLTGFEDRIQNVRNDLAARISTAAGQGAPGTIAAALVTGVSSSIPDDAQETLRATGLAHILSISGLHMALVAGIFLGALRASMALFPAFSARHPVKKYAALAALAGSSGYLLLAGSGVATQRSFIMLAVMLVAVIFDRAALTMRNLAVAAILILAVTPHEVAGPSFQMSFAATAALIAVYTWFARRRATRPGLPRIAIAGGKLRRLAVPVFQSTFAMALTAIVGGVSTAIYSAYHFHAVSTVGFAANVLTMPIISTVVMPMAVAGTLLVPFGLDSPFFAAMGWGMDMVMTIANHVQSWSDAGVTGIVPANAILLVTAGFVILVIMQTGLRWVGLAFMAAGLIAAAREPLPDILVDEGGRFLVVRQTNSIAVNLARPNEFALGIWQKALGGLPVVKPDSSAGPSGPSTGFVCKDTTCVLKRPGVPAIVAISSPKPTARDGLDHSQADRSPDRASSVRVRDNPTAWCGQDAIVVVGDASFRPRCDDPRTLFVNAKTLALRGSAAIYLGNREPDSSAPDLQKKSARPISVIHAYDETARPWMEYRRFSRAARGLPEWRPKANTKPAKATSAAEINNDG